MVFQFDGAVPEYRIQYYKTRPGWSSIFASPMAEQRLDLVIELMDAVPGHSATAAAHPPAIRSQTIRTTKKRNEW